MEVFIKSIRTDENETKSAKVTALKIVSWSVHVANRPALIPRYGLSQKIAETSQVGFCQSVASFQSDLVWGTIRPASWTALSVLRIRRKKHNNWKKIVGIKISAQPHTIVKQIKSVVPKAIYCFVYCFLYQRNARWKYEAVRTFY